MSTQSGIARQLTAPTGVNTGLGPDRPDSVKACYYRVWWMFGRVGKRVGSKDKRASYRRPDVAGARHADPVPTEPAAPQGSRHRGRGGAWWPLAAAAALTFVLVLLVVLANLDSAPIPSAP